MKIFWLLIVLLILLPSISAISIDLKPTYDSGETIIARISGNFIGSISSNNIVFYRDYTKIPFQTNILKLNGEYYIYTQTFGKPEGNYSIQLQNIQYFKQGLVENEDYSQNLTISNSTADFYINPGLISTNIPFTINIQNLRSNDLSLDIYENKTSSNTSSESPSFFDLLFGTDTSNNVSVTRTEIISGDHNRDLLFNLTKGNETELRFIELKSSNTNYKIPVELIVTDEEKIYPSSHLVFSPTILNFSMSTDSNTSRIVYLYNDGTTDLENISFTIDDSISKYLTLDIENIDSLKENKSIKLTLKFSSDTEEKNFSGTIKANYSNSYAYLEVFLDFLKDYIPLPGNNQTILDPAGTVESCSEKNGSICSEGYSCDGESEFANDGVCCLSSCIQDKVSSGGKLIGWLILILIGTALIWFFKTKYQK